MYKYLLFLSVFFFINTSYADCSSCVGYYEATVITKDNKKVIGWIEINSSEKPELTPSELLNDSSLYAHSNNKEIVIYKSIIQMRHPVFWSWEQTSLLNTDINEFQYPFILLASKNDAIVFNGDNVSKVILNYKKTFKLKSINTSYHYGSLKVVPPGLIDKMSTAKPILTLRWDDTNSTHYIYSYSHNIDNKDSAERILSPLGNMRNLDFSKFWKKPKPYLDEYVIYLPIYQDI